MARRKGRQATFTNIESGEMKKVSRGTKEFEKYKKKGWLTREQISHRKEYQPEYTPDYIESPEEENTDYPEADDRELLKERIEDMYDTIIQKLDEIPNEKYVSGKKYMNLLDSKQMLFNLVDDLYGQAESDDTVNYYLKTMLPKIAELVEAIYFDSTAEEVEYHLTLLAKILNQGNALSFEQASAMAESTELNIARPLGWYEKSSMLRDRF